MRKYALALLAALTFGLIGPAFAQAPPAVPALPDSERRTSYALSASTCPNCSVGFALYGDGTDYANWLELWLITGSGTTTAATKLTPVTDWTLSSVSGSLATLPRPITNATITLTSARTGTLQIVGARRPRRTSQFAENRGVAARDLNQVVTDLVAENRELWDKMGRALVTAPGDTVGALPAATVRAGGVLAFDMSGNPIAQAALTGLGNVVGPNVSVVGHIPIFANTSGTLLADGGTVGVGDVTGPSSAGVDHAVTFSSTTGKVMKDSGLTISPTTGTLFISNAKTFAVSSTLTLAGTDGKTLTVSNSGTLAGGDGFTLAIAAGKTLTASNSLTLSGTDGKSLALTTSGTIGGGDGWTFGIAAGKTLLAFNTLSFTGTDGTSFAFPSTSDTVVTLAAAQMLSSKTLTAPTIIGGTHTAITALGVRSTGSGAFDLTLNNTENLTAGRSLTVTVNNANRTLNLSGDLTLAAAFSTAGGSAITLTGAGVTNVTLPTTGTLATRDTSNTFSATNTFSALATLTDIRLSSGKTFPVSDSTTALQACKADGTTCFVRFDTANSRVGINKTPGAFDLDVTGAANIDGALTFGIGTITGLTVNNSPSAANDYLLYYNASANAIRRCTVGACGSAGIAGVSALNGLTGGLAIANGGGVSVAAAGTTITLQAANATPQGRLTLTSGTPVLTTTASAQTTVYYTAYVGRHVPVWSGTAMTAQGICADNTAGACELSVIMGGSASWASGSNYDWFVGLDGATARLCSGPAWSSTIARGAGVGTTEIQQFNGLWTNRFSMTCRYGAASTFTCGVNQCTYVGSMSASANGTTEFVFGGVGAGGSAASFRLWNAYNRRVVSTFVGDNTNSWTYGTAAFRSSNNSTGNRVTFISGLQEDGFSFDYNGLISGDGAGNFGANALGVDTTTAISGTSNQSNTLAQTAMVLAQYRGTFLGFHFVQAIEYSSGGTPTFFGDNGGGVLQTGLSAQLWM